MSAQRPKKTTKLYFHLSGVQSVNPGFLDHTVLFDLDRISAQTQIAFLKKSFFENYQKVGSEKQGLHDEQLSLSAALSYAQRHSFAPSCSFDR